MASAVAIRVERSPGEIRAVAVAGDGRALDLAISRPGQPGAVGALYRGRITARMPAMAGAFVDIGVAAGFLPDSAGGRGAGVGDRVAVRVIRAAQGGKGPRLQAETLDPGAGSPGLIAPAPDAVARLLAWHPGVPVETGFDAGLAEQLAALAERRVSLAGGGAMSIDPTPAVVAIDIDLGVAAGGTGSKTRTHGQAGAAVLPELARQIRLRNLSGGIVVDFAGLSPRRRVALAPGLAGALAQDPMRPRLLGFSALGLAEILRPRAEPPLHELHAGPHAAALGAARALTRLAGPGAAGRAVLRLAPGVYAAWFGDAVLQQELRHALGEAPHIQLDPALDPDSWNLAQP